jgi:hypothetical protein
MFAAEFALMSADQAASHQPVSLWHNQFSNLHCLFLTQPIKVKASL